MTRVLPRIESRVASNVPVDTGGEDESMAVAKLLAARAR